MYDCCACSPIINCRLWWNWKKRAPMTAATIVKLTMLHTHTGTNRPIRKANVNSCRMVLLCYRFSVYEMNWYLNRERGKQAQRQWQQERDGKRDQYIMKTWNRRRNKKNGSSQRVHEKWQIGSRTHSHTHTLGYRFCCFCFCLCWCCFCCCRYTLMHSDKVPTNFQPD